jgi:hypothetical protein
MLDLWYGILIGFCAKLPDVIEGQNNIDTTNMRIEVIQDEGKNTVLTILGTINPSIMAKLDIDNSCELNMDGKQYLTIKDLNDGDYLAIDKEGAVYIIIHDPPKINMIYKNVADFIGSVKSGRYDLDNPQIDI